MELEEKVKAVESVFDTLDEDTARFGEWAGLSCQRGCARCCIKPDIEASVLEFLPLAHYLYKNGKALEWLDKFTPETGPLCVMLVQGLNGSGQCTEYKHRGLICRLFGYSARVTKHGKKELVTCSTIKTEQRENFEKVSQLIAEGEAPVPVMSHYYMRLHGIDSDMARQFFPVNQAIRRAIEAILHYYAYRS